MVEEFDRDIMGVNGPSLQRVFKEEMQKKKGGGWK